MGYKGVETTEMILDGVRVPADQAKGLEQVYRRMYQGRAVLKEWLKPERVEILPEAAAFGPLAGGERYPEAVRAAMREMPGFKVDAAPPRED